MKTPSKLYFFYLKSTVFSPKIYNSLFWPPWKNIHSCFQGSQQHGGGELELAMSSAASSSACSSATSSQKFKLRHLQDVRSQSQINLQQHVFLSLKPLQFEVPCSSLSSSSSPSSHQSTFIGRQWIFRELHSILTSHLPTNRGVIIRGGPGTGKTALVLHLVEKSLQRGKQEAWIYN